MSRCGGATIVSCCLSQECAGYALSDNQCAFSETYGWTGIQTDMPAYNQREAVCWLDGHLGCHMDSQGDKHQGTQTGPCRYLLHRRLCRLGWLQCTLRGWWPAWQPGPACQLLHSAAAALCSVLPPTRLPTPVMISQSYFIVLPQHQQQQQQPAFAL